MNSTSAQAPARDADGIARASSALVLRYWGLLLIFLVCVGLAAGYYQWRAVQRSARSLLWAYASEYAAQLSSRLDEYRQKQELAEEQLASRPPDDVLRDLLRHNPSLRAALLLDAQGRPVRQAGALPLYPGQDPALSPLTRAAWRGCAAARRDCVAPPAPDPSAGRGREGFLVANLHRLDPEVGGARWLVLVHPQIFRGLLSDLRVPYPDAAIVALREDDHLLQMRSPQPSRLGYGYVQSGVLVRQLRLHPQAAQGSFVGSPTAVGHAVLGVFLRRPGLPFVIGVNLPFVTVYATWLRAMAPILAALLGSGLLGTWLLRKGLRGLRAEERAREATQDALREQIRYNRDLALRDALTGLLNRRGMDAALGEAIRLAREQGRGFAMILLDLDRFKVLNDSYGHQAGDQVLRVVAALLRQQLRPQDELARWGGEEFLVLLPDSDLEQGCQVAERLRSAIADEVVVHREHGIHMTASFGVAIWEGAGGSAERLLSRLDALLYDAKRAGRNQVRAAQAQHGGSLSVGSRLQQALHQRRLRVAYHKLIDLHSGQVVGQEALARLLTPQGEELEAAAFIDAAHHLRLEHSIDALVSRRALEHVAGRIGEGDGEAGAKLLINCSADFLSRSDMVQGLLGDARELLAALPPRRPGEPAPVVIEITERQLLGNLRETREMLQPLLDFGFELALDDFGSGYSSFLYLLDLPVRYLKIDKALVQRAVEEPRARAMVESIRSMAAGLGIVTIAEGIETQQTFELMRRLGVDWGQGFLWGRPELP
ncbi:MAG: EAL domain-containing protein [Betaproteobacteria bacterium]|nr:EAL domain-containing protein [Betaproteobacteria bacterium]MBU6511884.1 EAL domain-containing protein [Betaproteobacteria bacterium]MDE1954775.1 EAL domain-containing protein [Betaproteobacteria bacterium]MDE2152318.1 EAL domain-containing protein [Betaproteobacteria bacterium]